MARDKPVEHTGAQIEAMISEAAKEQALPRYPVCRTYRRHLPNRWRNGNADRKIEDGSTDRQGGSRILLPEKQKFWVADD